ncbi:PD-(D/E)XK motif protein [Sphingomonas sp. LHG3406-1]|uniref:PD-(D/E)XK motif protein n=1 Tax=Sphingomonas sp. LHG3406-1 TaxID=2804617 RepID=UPI00261AEE0A|nr:PD-(D/E)XK motif protein [Sphingomonas sp. LHG3406-1]
MKASSVKMNDPWQGLSAGSIDARRVSGEGKHDFFWITSSSSEPGLLLRLPAGIEEPASLPKLRNLEIAIRDVVGGRAIVILLKDPDQRELFVSLCRDVVGAAETAATTQDAVTRAVRRLLRWHHLLRGGRSDILSLEEQRGLIGELHFLERLVSLIGPRAAIEAWRGPFGASKDFELDSLLVEVKARRGAAKPYVQISSEDQLADVAGTSLFLCVSPVDAVIKPEGLTLADHVRRIEEIFIAADTDSLVLWEEAIQASGYDVADDYSDRRWKVGETLDHRVEGEFPRIVPPLTVGVGGVRYSISLGACSSYRMQEGDLDGLISGGGLP